MIWTPEIRDRARQNALKEVWVPSLQEIEAACDAIRGNWSHEERSSRWIAAHSVCNLSEIPRAVRRLSNSRKRRRTVVAAQSIIRPAGRRGFLSLHATR